MLTQEDIQHCLRVRSLFCTLKLIPLQVDHTKRRFRKLESKWGLSLCIFHYAHYLVRVGFINYGFLKALFHNEYRKEELHLLSWDVVNFFGGNLMALWYVILFVQKPEVTVCILNQAFASDCVHSVARKIKKRSCISYLRSHTRHELMAITIPYTLLMALLALLMAYAFESNFKTATISAVPQEYHGVVVKALWLMEEFWSSGHAAVLMILGATTHVLCFEKYLRTILSLKASLQIRRVRQVEDTYRALQNLQLNVMLFNEGNSYLIFSFKLLCISIAVSCGFGAIVCFDFNRTFVISSGLLSLDVIVTYCVFYEKAFAIPDGTKDLKKELLVVLHGRRIISTADKAMMAKKIGAIPSLGIRVGDFHTMERTSTPVFIDFVLRSLMNLLVLRA